MTGGTDAGWAGARPEAVTPPAPGPDAPCLDYRSQCHPAAPGRPSELYNRVRIFESGELEVRSVLLNARSKPPAPSYGSRRSRGVSARGRRVIRRAVGARVRSGACQVALYTLTSQEVIPDDEFRRRLQSWLMWARKHAGAFFVDYVWVIDLQQRGVLHAHLLLFRRIPAGLWRRLRDVWVTAYGMGPGSFDSRPVRKPSRAATYLARYISQSRSEAGGRVGRNGLPYLRDVFAGNAYGLSTSLRALSRHVTEFALPWGTGAALDAVNLRGMVAWFDTPAQAHSWLAAALEPARAGPRRA